AASIRALGRRRGAPGPSGSMAFITRRGLSSVAPARHARPRGDSSMRALVLMTLIASGCSEPTDVHFEHHEFCWEGCARASSTDRGHHVAAGARYPVWLDTYGLPPFSVSTSDDSVVAIASLTSPDDDPGRPAALVLVAGVPGTARLIFTDLGGAVLDEAEITVHEVGSLTLFERPPVRPLLMIGGT